MLATDERPVATVLHDIVGNIDRIVRAEVRIAAAELRARVDEAGGAAMLIVAGAACGTFAIAFLLLGVVYLLATVVAPWIAAVLVAIAAATVAALLVAAGRTRLDHALLTQRTDIASKPETAE